MTSLIASLSPELPVLIAGPTASGKSALAMRIAAAQGGVIINADALQVYGNWRVLTARPSVEDEAALPHALYGHVAGDHAYSVGDWLREVSDLLDGDQRPIIVGGTGLYFTALTEGLAEIPATPDPIRAEAMARIAAGDLAGMLAELDAPTADRIDRKNPMRVQRAWEVLRATGRGLAEWQADTPAPALPLTLAQPLVFDCARDWLWARIARRFDLMIAGGAMDEARANAPHWDPAAPSSKAIGAAELVACVRATMTLDDARAAAIIATRQYAKRQRSWFRGRMTRWTPVTPD